MVVMDHDPNALLGLEKKLETRKPARARNDSAWSGSSRNSTPHTRTKAKILLNIMGVPHTAATHNPTRLFLSWFEQHFSCGTLDWSCT